MRTRSKPYIWVTWLAPLLVGESDCQWKAWMQAHYQDLNKRQRDDGFDASKWNQEHTQYSLELREEYASKCKQFLIEGETSWKIDGRTATVAGKMDLVTLKPNLVIDAKTGKKKNSHVAQLQIYLLAIELGCLPLIGKTKQKFSGVLRYRSGEVVNVPPLDDEFRARFYDLVRRLAGPELATTPSKHECKFCDLADCTDRVDAETPAALTDEF